MKTLHNSRRLWLEPLEDRRLLSATPEMVSLIGGTDSSSPERFVTIGATTFFTANDGVHGWELWKTDGTPDGTELVMDIQPGALSSNVGQFTEFNGQLYFTADDGVHGRELWTAGGSLSGAQMVQDIEPGGSSSPDLLTVSGNRLFFQATTSATGAELWRTEGDSATTLRLTDLMPGPSSSQPLDLADVDGTLYFSASSPATGRELFKSDGTAGGTFLVADIYPGAYSSNPGQIVNANGTVYFSAGNLETGYELWKSDGTAGGTLLAADVLQGPSGSTPQKLISFGSAVLFVAADAEYGYELRRSDGQLGDTQLLRDINPGPDGAFIQDFTLVGDQWFFVAYDEFNKGELWCTDGTPAGTRMLSQIVGNQYASPRYPVEMNGLLVFAVDDGDQRHEIWTSDGTVEGTQLRVALPNTAGFDGPKNLHYAAGNLLFSADPDKTGFELWSYNFQSASLALVKDINRQGPGTTISNPVNVNGQLLFAANESGLGNELWTSLGSLQSTAPLKDIFAGSQSSQPFLLNYFNGALFFTAYDSTRGRELWTSDGTPEGTQVVKDLYPGFYFAEGYPVGPNSSSPERFVAAGGRLFFTAQSPTGRDLWVTDGTADGTQLVKDFYDDGLSLTGVGAMAEFNGELYFSAQENPSIGFELWKSNGTPGGTMMVKEINTYNSPMYGFGSYPARFENVNGTLFFSASDLFDTGEELWKTDGTEAGTVLVKDIRAGFDFYGALGSDPTQFTKFGNQLYFLADDGVHGREVWKSDGSAAGTQMVADFMPGAGSSSPQIYTVFNDELYFTVDDGVHGAELWKTDGTDVTLVKDILPGAAGSGQREMLALPGRLYFAADDGVHGSELWQTDGTNAGTQMVYDLNPGPTGSLPEWFAELNGDLLLSANSGIGRQLWRFDAPQPIIDLNGSQDGVDYLATFNPGGSDVSLSDIEFFLSDPIADTALSATVTGIAFQPEDVLVADTAGTNIAFSYINGVASLSGTDSLSNYALVLKSIAFNTSSLSTQTRAFQFTITTTTATSPAATAYVSVNQPPAVDLNGPMPGIDYTISHTNGPVAAVDSLRLTVQGPLSTLDYATIGLGNFDPLDQLGIDTSGTNITIMPFVGGMWLVGVDTLEHYAQVLQSITFDTTSTNTNPRTLSIYVTVGTASSYPALSTIYLQRLTLDLNGFFQPDNNFETQYLVGSTPTPLTDQFFLGISGTFLPTILSATVTGSNYQPGDLVTFDTTGTNISYSYAGGTASLSGEDTISRYQQVLMSARFSTTSYATQARHLAFVVTNAERTSAPAISTVSIELPTNSTVVGRRLFYNQSGTSSPLRYDSNNAAINANDDLAIATDKTALLPGQTATFANVSSYTKGINGIMIDVAGAHGTITASDFIFRVGNNNTPNSWAAAPAPNSISVRAGAGVSGSDRIELTWANGAITKKWLEVIVLANANTGLAQKPGYPVGQGDVFFFGSAPGDTGLGDTATQANVNSTDELGARNNPATVFSNVPITNIYDFNRDAQVNSTDALTARNNVTSIGNVTRFITVASPPTAPESADDGGVASALSAPAAATELASAGVPRWLINRLDHLDVNSGPIAKFFEHLAHDSAPAARRALTAIEHVLEDLGVEDDLLDSLLGSK